MHPTTILFLAVASLPGSERSDRSAPPFDRAALAAHLDAVVHYDRDDAGALWARGRDWKMSFDGRRAVYYPLLGPRQEEPLPHSLTPALARVGSRAIAVAPTAEARRIGDRIDIDRGEFVERYELTPERIEQLFVFPDVPLGGDLVLLLPVESTLERVEREDALEFRAELGGFRYSRAVAIDGRGERTSAVTRFVGGAIEIRVGADFLATAEAPLVIDPIVWRWSVDTSGAQDSNPDVAYDASTDRWLIVWERRDGGDRDVAYQLVSDWGEVFASGYVNLDGTGWSRPKCANNNAFDTFYTVANVMISGGWQVRGRIMSAWDGQAGATFTVSDGSSGEYCFNPDVGGDPRTVWWSTYCVVFERLKNNGDTDVYYRRAGGTGGPIGSSSTKLVGSIYPEVMPSISKSNDGREWAVAFDRNAGSTDGVFAGRIGEDGNISGYPYQVMTTTADDNGPRVATMLNGTLRFLVASASQVSAQKDVLLVAMDGYTKLAEVNLGALEFGGPLNYAAQDLPSLDSDGSRFLVAYRELVNGDQNLFATTLRLSGSTLQVLDNRFAIRATSQNDESLPAVASKESSGGVARRTMVAWMDVWRYANAWNIWAATFDML